MCIIYSIYIFQSEKLLTPVERAQNFIYSGVKTKMSKFWDRPLQFPAAQLTHPAARSLCDSWATCYSSVYRPLCRTVVESTSAEFLCDVISYKTVIPEVYRIMYIIEWLSCKQSFVYIPFLTMFLHFVNSVYSALVAMVGDDFVTLLTLSVAVIFVPALLCFLPRCMECRRGLAMRIPSVRPSVCLSVRPSVRQTRELWQNGRKICLDFLYDTKDNLF